MIRLLHKAELFLVIGGMTVAASAHSLPFMRADQAPKTANVDRYGFSDRGVDLPMPLPTKSKNGQMAVDLPMPLPTKSKNGQIAVDLPMPLPTKSGGKTS